ncbi:serine/threonine-protein kinase [Actinoallomurus rhizosphaericola]|uniref:serine/threonine-protein kinase n=1 Tax=Actinoallomurus rhizosphaericola TaxID=2952536 RepID=UPI00209189D4|nr:serine/threonine-protein kinase [Actinoallomurus rhizosphaericola]MCO5993189.1 serine/threonine protein kinase [Actinoallomurus rhizosphaericola]
MPGELSLEAGLLLARRYRLDAPIGAGAMGQVWRGVDLGLNRPIAIKILPSHVAQDQTGVARFRREAESAAGLQHPGICAVFDIDLHGSVMFLVMELLQGSDLARVVAAHPGGLPIDQAVGLAEQITDALAVAHARGVVHRDIKPANLFLQQDGRVKICDFGIARLADRTTLTATGGLLGTPRYMAPEEFRGVPADDRADLYALGGVLYELFTGRPAFDTDDPGLASIMYKHLNEAPLPLRSHRPDIPVHLERLVLDLLAKSADQRPVSAAAVRDFLRRSGHTAVPPAGPPPYLRPQPPTVDQVPGTPTVTTPSAVPKSRKRVVAAVGGVLGAALLTAGALTLPSAFGGDGSKPKTTATAHPSSTGLRTLRPNGDTVPGQAGPGTWKQLGQMAVVPVIQGMRTDAVGVTVTSIVKGSKADLAPLALSRSVKDKTPYYVHFSLTNLGPDDPYMTFNPTYAMHGADSAGASVGDTITSRDTKSYPSQCRPVVIEDGGFRHGARYDTCTVILNPRSGDITTVQWCQEPYDFGKDQGIYWKR